MGRGKRTVARLPRTHWATFAASLRQILIETKRVIFLAVDEAVDCLLAYANTTEAVRLQTSGNLFRRPAGLQLVDDLGAQSRMAPQLYQSASTVSGDVVSNRAVVAVIIWQFTVMKRVALDLTVNGRAMTAKLTRHLVNGNLCRHQMMKTAAIGKGDLRIASGHAKISKVKPLKSLACRT
ncbi:IS30 family transposase [Agrobacterium sp. ATCC 31749]|nr:IS30 family transposase [Agrobacterium sp. ATCC 31749]